MMVAEKWKGKNACLNEREMMVFTYVEFKKEKYKREPIYRTLGNAKE